MQLTLPRRLLQLVFALSSSPATITRPLLERNLGVPLGGLDQAIEELSRSGLLDAERLRLTFPGLALVVASGAHTRAKPRAQQTQAKPRTLQAKPSPPSAAREPIALFSRRETSRAVA